MISYIKGTVIHQNPKYLIIENASLGYKVFSTSEILLKNNEGDTAILWTYHIIREDTNELIGFESMSDLQIFELLLTVSGIGPKTALGILNNASVSSIKKAVTSGDSSHLVKVGGVNKKNADKIVLELKGKITSEEDDLSTKDEIDALEALKALGFTHKDAREALSEIPRSVSSTRDRVKMALKMLSK